MQLRPYEYDASYQFPGVREFGCDPELFLRKNGKVIGSERVIGLDGHLRPLDIGAYYDDGNFYKDVKPGVVCDGVQAEIHIEPLSCRANFSNGIKKCLRALEAEANKHGATTSLHQLVTVSEMELGRLSEKSQVLGCEPSLSIYGDRPADVDGREYRRRSAGGHIHMSYFADLLDDEALKERIVQMLDIFVGNTCVMLDRSKGAVERRKNYGRAGEYRSTKYGLEYRTLSNFWLHSPHLVTLILGLCHTAVRTALMKPWWDYEVAPRLTTTAPRYGDYNPYYGWKAPDPWPADWILEQANPRLIRKAINENDYELAVRNFRSTVHPFVCRYSVNKTPNLDRETLGMFYYLSHRIRTEGIAKVFGVTDTERWLAHWLPDAHNTGWGDWCRRNIDAGFQSFMEKRGEAIGFTRLRNYPVGTLHEFGRWFPTDALQEQS